MQGVSKPSNNSPHAPNSGGWIKWAAAVFVILILFQFKAARPYTLGLLALVLLGMVLANFNTIQSQFSTIGGKSHG